MSIKVDGIAGFEALVGQHLGYSDWIEVSQDRIQQFADATDDHQWIHLDVARCKKESPFGGTIAHGYLTLAMIPVMYRQILDISGVQLTINYGTNKVRFPSPVPSGSKVRLGLEVAAVDEVKGGVQCTFKGIMEIEGAEKPAMAAELLYRYLS